MSFPPPSSPSPALRLPSFAFSDTTQRDYKTFNNLLSSSFPHASSSPPTINWMFQSSTSSTNHIFPLHATLCSKQYISEVRPIEGGLGEAIVSLIPPTLEDPSLPLPPSRPHPWDGECYIVKPPDSCNGVGISLCKTAPELQKKASAMGIRIIQKYLEHPYLLHLPSESSITSTPSNYKFDIRQWVMLVIDANKKPKLYIWGTFYVRICSLPFKLSGEGWADPRRHFSNLKINDEFGGEVWGEEQFKNFVCSRGDGAKFEQFKSAIHSHVKTAVKSTLHHILHSPPMRFEILGFDFLVDNNLNPYLCEVNESPGLRRTRGGVDVSDEVEAMCHQAYDLTINRWFHSPPLPSPPKFHPFVWERASGFGEVEFHLLNQVWSNPAGRELGVDGSLLSISATPISLTHLLKLEKAIDAPEKIIIVKRTISTYISRYLLRRRLGLTTQRLYRGSRGRNAARRLLEIRSTRRIVRLLRKGVLHLKHGRVMAGLQRLFAVNSAASVRISFLRMLREARIKRALSRVNKLHLRCAKFIHFQRWRQKVVQEKVLHRFLNKCNRYFRLRHSSADKMRRAFQSFSLRLRLRRSASARLICKWWQYYNVTRRFLRRLINLRRAHSQSVLKRALLRIIRGARDRRLEMLVVKYRKLEAQEVVKIRHQEERHRLKMEKEEREEREREEAEQRRVERMERIRKEKERQALERASVTALSYSIKSVKTLKGISEHERLMRELTEVMDEEDWEVGEEEQREEQENEEVMNIRPQPPIPPTKKARGGRKRERFEELLHLM